MNAEPSAGSKPAQVHDSDSFAGKVLCVTGGVRGIGLNIARAFGSKGASVVICDIDEPTGILVQQELTKAGIDAIFLPVDLRAKGSPQTMIREIVCRCGRLDCLVNNARALRPPTCSMEDEDMWDDAMRVMLRAPYFASQEAIRAMTASGGGSIVNIGSIAGILACHESASYHVAKAGILQMTRYLAMHAGRQGVRVNAVLPGFIIKDESQDRYENNDNYAYRHAVEFCHPVGYPGKADDVTNMILFLCSAQASFISGQGFIVDGGLTIQDPSDLLIRFDKETR